MTKRLDGGRVALALLATIAVVLSLFVYLVPQARADHIPATRDVPEHCVRFDFDDTGSQNVGSQNVQNFPGVSITLDAWDETPNDPHLAEFTIAGLTGSQYVDVSVKSGLDVDEDGPYVNGDYTIRTVEHAISHITFCVFVGESDKGKIIIKKEVTENSNTTIVFDFSASYDQDGFSLSDGQKNEQEVEPGTYTVSEVVPAGWVLESATCVSTDEEDDSTPKAINVSANETVTCTFLNHEPRTTTPTTPTTEPPTTSPTSSIPFDSVPTSEVLGTTITAAPVDTLPFTGIETETFGLIAMALLGTGALVLTAARSTRRDSE